MKSLIAVLSTVAFAAATLLAMPAVVSAQGSPAPDFMFQPEREFQTGIARDQRVKPVEGASTLPTDAPVASARWIGIDASGNELVEGIRRELVEPANPNATSFIRNSANGLTFSLSTACAFGDPAPAELRGCPPHPAIKRGLLEVTLHDGGVYRSNSMRVDFTEPVMTNITSTTPTRVTVYFTEPVRVLNRVVQDFQDSPGDWQVGSGTNEIPVVRVESPANDCQNRPEWYGHSGCTRVLVLSRPLGEDEEPIVIYRQALVDANDPTREEYEDFAGLGAVVFQRDVDDLRRPRIPDIQTVDGRSPAVPAADDAGCAIAALPQVLSNDPRPTLTFNNIINGHRFVVDVDGNEVIGAADPVAGTPVATQLPDVLADGGHQIRVVAIDANGNRSDVPSTDPPPGATDGDVNPICYLVDTAPPLPGIATRSTDNPNAVLVTILRDDLVEQNLRGEWHLLGSVPQTASSVSAGSTDGGADSPRVLEVVFPEPVSVGATEIRWRCRDGNGDPCGPNDTARRYRDAAGNGMADFTLPIQLPPAPLPPVITRPSQAVLTNENPYEITGTIAPANDPSDIAEIEVTVGSDVQTVQPVDRAWGLAHTFPGDGNYHVSAVATNAFGDVSNPRSAPIIEYDGTAPAVVIESQEPEQGLLGEEPAREGAGEPFSVRFTVNETHFDRAEVTLRYADGTSEAPVVLDDGQTDGLEQLSVTLSPKDGYIGEATISAVAYDLAGNDTVNAPVERLIELTDTIAGDPVGTLGPNERGNAQILLEFPVQLTGNSTFNDWSATNGIDPDSARKNPRLGGVTRGDDSVTLTFNEPFPSLLEGPDRNASPLVFFDPQLGTTDLAAADGRELDFADGVVARDVDVPEVPTVTPAEVGPVALNGEAPDGVDCSASPIPQGCPGTYTFTGSTHASARPNRCFYTQISSEDGSTVITDPVRRPCGDEDGLVNPDGTFAATVPVIPNATSTFRFEVVDPAGNQAADANGTPLGTVVSVIEDSLGPDVDTLFASLVDGDTIDINYGFLPEDGAVQVALSYSTPGEELEPIATLGVDETGEGSLAWNFPDTIDLASGGLQIHAVGTDQPGNDGQPAVTGLSNLPTLRSAFAGSLTSVTVTTSEPVATDTPNLSGFAISGGPGVTSATVDDEDRIVLALNGELPGSQNLLVTYNGAGGWAAPDGRPLMSGSVPLAVDLVLPVTDLAAGATGPGSAVLSYVDERNAAGLVAGYEISRDGEVLATVPRSARVFSDDAAGPGAHTYSVVTVANDGRRSVPASVSILLGETPVPEDKGQAAESGGTGFPSTSEIVDPCVFTAEPNITPSAGGIVLSCDGRVAALVPPGATQVPLFGKLIRRTDAAADGFASLTDLYQLVAVTDGDFATVDAFARYTELSFRALGEIIGAGTPELMTTLRLNDALADEQAPRVGHESLSVHLLTVGTFRTVEAHGRSIRVYGPDPAIPSDRFATAVALSQTQFRRAGAAVLARADDYPDALSAAPLAALVGGPVLLSRTDLVPPTTVLELQRLGVQTITIVGGAAAVSPGAEQQLVDLGFTVRRIAGDNRFTTSALVAREVGSVDGEAFMATGQNFADALSASAPAAKLGRPILLTATDSLLDVTLDAARAVGIDAVHLVGGTAAISDDVGTAVAAAGFTTVRSAGRNRSETAVVLATNLLAEGLVTAARPLVASADGDGRTSPDALAAGPVSGRLGSILLLTPKSVLPDEVAAFIGGAEGLAGMLIAGGPAAIDPDVRVMIDATG